LNAFERDAAMKRKADIAGSKASPADDNRWNFAQVPSMMKPIPVPKVKSQKQGGKETIQ
jgi:hypothetical protein